MVRFVGALFVLWLLSLTLLVGCESSSSSESDAVSDPTTKKAALAAEAIDESAQIKCDTTAGPMEWMLYRQWSPNGYDRVLTLMDAGYYNNSPFFRVIPNFLVQFGLSYDADKKIRELADSKIADDHPTTKIPFVEGTIAFAGSGADSRTSQLFISYGKNAGLGKQPWETPIGYVRTGMDNVHKFFSYGDMPPWGKGPEQGKIRNLGKSYMDENFPKVDTFLECTVQRRLPKKGLDISGIKSHDAWHISADRLGDLKSTARKLEHGEVGMDKIKDKDFPHMPFKKEWEKLRHHEHIDPASLFERKQLEHLRPHHLNPEDFMREKEDMILGRGEYKRRHGKPDLHDHGGLDPRSRDGFDLHGHLLEDVRHRFQLKDRDEKNGDERMEKTESKTLRSGKAALDYGQQQKQALIAVGVLVALVLALVLLRLRRRKHTTKNN